MATQKENKHTDITRIIQPFARKYGGIGDVFKKDRDMELEGRLTPGPETINREYFEQIIKFFQNNYLFCYSYSDTWHGYQVNKYPDNVREIITEKGTTWMRKKPILKHDFEVKGRPFDIRIALSEEITCPPQKSEILHVRYIRRNSFHIVKGFRCDFSMIWQGKNAEMCHASTPTYEIEVECDRSGFDDEDTGEDIIGGLFCRMLELQGVEERFGLSEKLIQPRWSPK